MAGPQRKTYYVYLLASLSRVLYVGMTSDLERRLAQHRRGVDPAAFTRRYRVTRLVYVEAHGEASAAVARERSLKGWRRTRKVALIEARNPGWHDLAPEVTGASHRAGHPARQAA